MSRSKGLWTEDEEEVMLYVRGRVVRSHEAARVALRGSTTIAGQQKNNGSFKARGERSVFYPESLNL